MINDFITNCGDGVAVVTIEGKEVTTYGCSRTENETHTHSSDLATSNFFSVYRENGPYLNDDEALYYEFNAADSQGSKLVSTIKVITTSTEIVDDEETEVVTKTAIDNMSSFPCGGTVKLEITPNSTLKTTYPHARVIIDGKDFNLNILNSPVEFNMTQLQAHRIKIQWAKDLIESFRVVAIR